MPVIKRVTAAPTTLNEGQLAVDVTTGNLYIGGTSSTEAGDGLTAGIIYTIPTSGNVDNWQDPVINIETTDPTVSPTEGDRYLILGVIGGLHANFGTITTPVAAAQGDILEYVGGQWVVAYDATAGLEGAMVWRKSNNAVYVQTNTTTWVNSDPATVSLQAAYDVGVAVVVTATNPIALSVANGVDSKAMEITQGNNGANRAALDVRSTGTACVYIESAGTAINAATGNVTLGAGNIGLTAGDITLTDGMIIGTPQALAGPGGVDLTHLVTAFTSTGVGDALTLGNGTAGQLKIVVYVGEGGGGDTGILSPTTTCGTWSTVTFTAVGDSATLVYTSAGWAVIGTSVSTMVA